MKKTLFFIAIVIFVTVISGLIYQLIIGGFFVSKKSIILDPKNISYTIDGEKIALVNGVSEKDILDSNSKKVTRYFGNEVRVDLNGDGIEDAAFLLTQNSGGSGTFYYIAAALSSKDGYNGTNAIFFGDRISPQTTEFRNGEIIVNYADRRIDEPMVAFPSIGVSKYFKISDGNLTEVLNAEELPGNITYNNSSSDLIVVDLPFSNAVVGKDFSVIGKARGTWFFEASFPIQVIDKDGIILATSIAMAQSDWMTEGFVPFKADIKIPEYYIGPATLILKKDNPSGSPTQEASISFPINIEY